jgi:hypothetical protein
MNMTQHFLLLSSFTARFGTWNHDRKILSKTPYPSTKSEDVNTFQQSIAGDEEFQLVSLLRLVDFLVPLLDQWFSSGDEAWI